MTENAMFFITPTEFIKVYQGTRSEVWCYREYRKLKDAYGLTEPRHIPTLEQFCEYMALDETKVKRCLGWLKAEKPVPA